MKRSATAPLIFALLLTSASFAASAQVEDDDEEEDQHEFNYNEGSGIGPEDWGNIKPEWASCKDGLQQSPIDLEDTDAILDPLLGKLEHNYLKSDAKLRNRGHDIEMEWPNDAGHLTLGGIDYTLLQLHWHSPSEHAINGKRSDLEMHMVHRSAKGDHAVVGVLFKCGPGPDPLLMTLRRPLRWLADDTEIEEVPLGDRWPWDLDQLTGYYYHYNGSLTTPPCTESVTWIVMNQIMPVECEQVDWLRRAVHDGFENNARPLQLVNGRNIYKSRAFEPDASY